MKSLAAPATLSQEENNDSGIQRDVVNAHARTRLKLVWDDGYGFGGPVPAPVCCFCAREIHNLNEAIVTQLNPDDREAVVAHLSCYHEAVPAPRPRVFWLRADRVFHPHPTAAIALE